MFPDPGDRPVLARWAAEHPKRFLAATIAVGTVDQALLILPSKCFDAMLPSRFERYE